MRVSRKDGREGSSGPGSRAAIRDIAERAGVSMATVSRVLNGRPDVAASTRAAVLQQVREAGYVSNRIARASYDAGLIALSVQHIHGDYITEIITGAVEALSERNARLLICSTPTGIDPSMSLRDRLRQGATDGALLISPTASTTELATLHESGYPFVVIDPMVPVPDHIPVVASANWAGAKLATEHLIGLGHTHIGLIIGPESWSASIDRRAGYQAALLTAGLPLVPALVQAADMSIEGGTDAAERLLSRAHSPTAIVAMNDYVAIGVMRAARERRLTIPNDLSVVGFGDIELASLVAPPLTTVQQPFRGVGRVSIDVLYRLLQGLPLNASRVELSTKLIDRDSTAAPRGKSFLTY
jgi:LacI family transcriptional regulator, galactose operon repressor